ncbi:MAG: maleylpyruvate isomerase family mycothiol-dependent enzyme [Pseudonocardia sp.]
MTNRRSATDPSDAGHPDIGHPAGALPAVDPTQARNALADTVPRLATLLRSVRDPGRPALGQWSVADVAAHLAVVFENLPRLAARQAPPPIPGLSVFGDVMVDMVRAEPERDLAVLADRIDAAAAAFLDGPAVTDPDGLRPWIFVGTEVSGTTFVCHLLNEALVHGYDIARGAGRTWRIERSHAALALGGFALVGMAQLAGTGLVDQRRAAGVRARYRLRIRGGIRVDVQITDGELAIGAPSGRRVDCHVSGDPVVLLLLLWGRRSQWGPIARGQLTAWGRRPWLGPRLRSLIVNP